MRTKIIFCWLVVLMFFSGACAMKTKTGPSTVVGVETETETIIGTAGDSATGGSKDPAIGTGTPPAASSPVGMDIGLIMDRQEEELQRILVGSETISLKREQDILVLIFRSDGMFDFDSVEINPGVQAEIRRVADVFYRYPETRIRIEGHTDSIGSVEFNQMLSERRADAAKNELIARNLQPERIQAVGFGAAMPVASNATPAGRQQNRRVQIFIIPVGGRS
jgi:outer membrane protein OmpA-like peptidoglycan-associated protein